jgi:hypothetical protein
MVTYFLNFEIQYNFLEFWPNLKIQLETNFFFVFVGTKLRSF